MVRNIFWIFFVFMDFNLTFVGLGVYFGKFRNKLKSQNVFKFQFLQETNIPLFTTKTALL